MIISNTKTNQKAKHNTTTIYLKAIWWATNQVYWVNFDQFLLVSLIITIMFKYKNFPSLAQQHLVGQGLLIIEAWRSQTHRTEEDSSGRVISPTKKLFIQKNPTRCYNVLKFIISYLYETQYVSGDTPPIMRSLKTALAVSGFTYVEGCLDVWLLDAALLVVVCQTTTNNSPTATLQR
jgi:hypothetical protein